MSIIITINQLAPQPQRVRSMKPPIRINDANFRKGFYIGLEAGLHGLDFEEKLLSSDIIDSIKDLVNDGAFTEESDRDLQQIIGGLFGRVVACM